MWNHINSTKLEAIKWEQYKCICIFMCMHAVKSNQEHHYENSGQLEFEMKFHYTCLLVIRFLYRYACMCWANSNHRPMSKCTHRLTHFVAKFFQVVFPLALPLPSLSPISFCCLFLANEQERRMEIYRKQENWYHLHYYSAQVSSDEEPKRPERKKTCN